MGKLVLLPVFVACVVALHPEPAHAASELENWCIAQGASWQAENSRCLLLTAMDATVTGALALLPDEIISNYGTVTNDGDIDISGTIDNFGTFVNYSYVHNVGGIYNYSGAQVRNYGNIANESTIANYSTIHNYGTLDNHADIYNYGTIYNSCTTAIGPQPPLNQPGGVIYDLNNCCFLPVVTRG